MTVSPGYDRVFLFPISGATSIPWCLYLKPHALEKTMVKNKELCLSGLMTELHCFEEGVTQCSNWPFWITTGCSFCFHNEMLSSSLFSNIFLFFSLSRASFACCWSASKSSTRCTTSVKTSFTFFCDGKVSRGGGNQHSLHTALCCMITFSSIKKICVHSVPSF